jgi:predicted nucleic acid-binding protein
VLQFCHSLGCLLEKEVVSEILYGIELLPKGKRRAKLLAEAEAMFAEDFAGRTLPFDEDAARAFSEIAAGRRGKRRPMAEFDAQIAAIARSRGATLATRNTADFEDCGIAW